MLKRSAIVAAMLVALAACTPGSSPSPSVEQSFEVPSVEASPSASDEMSPGSSDEMTESASPSSS